MCIEFFEDHFFWCIGCIEGTFCGCFLACMEHKNTHADKEFVNEMYRGSKYGFSEGTWLGHLDE